MDIDFVEHLARQIAFSKGTSGPGPRTAGCIDHIRKELVEIEQSETNQDRAEEWVDVAKLALDGLWRAVDALHRSEKQSLGTMQIARIVVAMLLRKQDVIEDRVWPDWRTADPNKAIEHDRTVAQC